MSACSACPRNCTVADGKSGFCGNSFPHPKIRLAHACLHFGEEPPITGKGGSGTIFVSGCNLRCSFCQNFQISHGGLGREVDAIEFAEICMRLQDAGAENINIVTGSHVIPAIAEGIQSAKKMGLTIPVCWNSSAYEKVSTLALLDGLVDIWLPDLKTLDGALSQKLFCAPDYPAVATEAILHMLDSSYLRFQKGDGAPLASGVIIRHLILPGLIENSIRVLDRLKKYADKKAIISVMTQYTPVAHNNIAHNIERFLSAEEYREVTELLDAYNFEHIFYQEFAQELAMEDASWLPDFRKKQVFPSELAKPIWSHLRE